MFCKKCKSLMFPKDGKIECRKCGTVHNAGKAEKISINKTEKEEKGILDESQTLPTIRADCPKCHHNRASWVIRQTRAADEPATRIYRCVKCKHSWREY